MPWTVKRTDYRRRYGGRRRTMSRTGYSFAGWNTAADGSGTPTRRRFDIQHAAADVTLHAQWTLNTYRVTYNSNGHDSGSAPVAGNDPNRNTFR